MSSLEESPEFVCPVCNKSFHDQMSSLEESPEFVCEVCNKSFHDHGKLVQHSLEHYDTKPFPCKICSRRRFASQRTLDTHCCRHHKDYNQPHTDVQLQNTSDLENNNKQTSADVQLQNTGTLDHKDNNKQPNTDVQLQNTSDHKNSNKQPSADVQLQNPSYHKNGNEQPRPDVQLQNPSDHEDNSKQPRPDVQLQNTGTSGHENNSKQPSTDVQLQNTSDHENNNEHPRPDVRLQNTSDHDNNNEQPSTDVQLQNTSDHENNNEQPSTKFQLQNTSDHENNNEQPSTEFQLQNTSDHENNNEQPSTDVQLQNTSDHENNNEQPSTDVQLQNTSDHENNNKQPSADVQNSSDPGNSYKCQACDREFASQHALCKHECTSSKSDDDRTRLVNNSVGNSDIARFPYQCKLCSRSFPTQHGLGGHRSYYYSKKSKKVLIQYAPNKLVDHKKSKRQPSANAQTKSEPKNSKRRPNADIQNLSEQKKCSKQPNVDVQNKLDSDFPYKCNICDTEFQFLLNDHQCSESSGDGKGFLANSGNTGTYWCRMCNQSFHNKQALLGHTLTVHANNSNTQPNEDVRSDSEHETPKKNPSAEVPDNYDPNFPFVCVICDQRFSVRISLRKHLKVHSKSDKRRALKKYSIKAGKASNKAGKLSLPVVSVKALDRTVFEACEAISTATNSSDLPYQCYICHKKYTCKLGHLKIHKPKKSSPTKVSVEKVDTGMAVEPVRVKCKYVRKKLMGKCRNLSGQTLASSSQLSQNKQAQMLVKKSKNFLMVQRKNSAVSSELLDNKDQTSKIKAKTTAGVQVYRRKYQRKIGRTKQNNLDESLKQPPKKRGRKRKLATESENTKISRSRNENEYGTLSTNHIDNTFPEETDDNMIVCEIVGSNDRDITYVNGSERDIFSEEVEAKNEESNLEFVHSKSFSCKSYENHTDSKPVGSSMYTLKKGDITVSNGSELGLKRDRTSLEIAPRPVKLRNNLIICEIVDSPTEPAKNVFEDEEDPLCGKVNLKCANEDKDQDIVGYHLSEKVFEKFLDESPLNNSALSSHIDPSGDESRSDFVSVRRRCKEVNFQEIQNSMLLDPHIFESFEEPRYKKGIKRPGYAERSPLGEASERTITEEVETKYEHFLYAAEGDRHEGDHARDSESPAGTVDTNLSLNQMHATSESRTSRRKRNSSRSSEAGTRQWNVDEENLFEFELDDVERTTSEYDSDEDKSAGRSRPSRSTSQNRRKTTRGDKNAIQSDRISYKAGGIPGKANPKSQYTNSPQFQTHETELLEWAYRQSPYVHRDRKDPLAKLLGVTQRRVAAWFTYRRWKEKHQKSSQPQATTFTQREVDREIALKERRASCVTLSAQIAKQNAQTSTQNTQNATSQAAVELLSRLGSQETLTSPASHPAFTDENSQKMYYAPMILRKMAAHQALLAWQESQRNFAAQARIRQEEMSKRVGMHPTQLRPEARTSLMSIHVTQTREEMPSKVRMHATQLRPEARTSPVAMHVTQTREEMPSQVRIHATQLRGEEITSQMRDTSSTTRVRRKIQEIYTPYSSLFPPLSTNTTHAGISQCASMNTETSTVPGPLVPGNDVVLDSNPSHKVPSSTEPPPAESVARRGSGNTDKEITVDVFLASINDSDDDETNSSNRIEYRHREASSSNEVGEDVNGLATLLNKSYDQEDELNADTPKIISDSESDNEEPEQSRSPPPMYEDHIQQIQNKENGCQTTDMIHGHPKTAHRDTQHIEVTQAVSKPTENISKFSKPVPRLTLIVHNSMLGNQTAALRSRENATEMVCSDEGSGQTVADHVSTPSEPSTPNDQIPQTVLGLPQAHMNSPQYAMMMAQNQVGWLKNYNSWYHYGMRWPQIGMPHPQNNMGWPRGPMQLPQINARKAENNSRLPEPKNSTGLSLNRSKVLQNNKQEPRNVAELIKNSTGSPQLNRKMAAIKRITRNSNDWKDTYRKLAQIDSTFANNYLRLAQQDKKKWKEITAALNNARSTPNKTAKLSEARIDTEEGEMFEPDPDEYDIVIPHEEDKEISESHEFEGEISEPDQENDEIVEPFQEEGTVSEPNQDESTLSECNQSEGTITEHNQSKGAITDRNQSEGTITEHNQSEGTITEHNQSEGTITEHNQSEGTISECNQSEGVISERNQSEGTISERNQSEGAISERNQSEGTISERNQSEGAISESNQSEGAITEPNQEEAKIVELNQEEITRPSLEKEQVAEPDQDEGTQNEPNPSERKLNEPKPNEGNSTGPTQEEITEPNLEEITKSNQYSSSIQVDTQVPQSETLLMTPSKREVCEDKTGHSDTRETQSEPTLEVCEDETGHSDTRETQNEPTPDESPRWDVGSEGMSPEEVDMNGLAYRVTGVPQKEAGTPKSEILVSESDTRSPCDKSSDLHQTENLEKKRVMLTNLIRLCATRLATCDARMAATDLNTSQNSTSSSQTTNLNNACQTGTNSAQVARTILEGGEVVPVFDNYNQARLDQNEERTIDSYSGVSPTDTRLAVSNSRLPQNVPPSYVHGGRTGSKGEIINYHNQLPSPGLVPVNMMLPQNNMLLTPSNFIVPQIDPSFYFGVFPNHTSMERGKNVYSHSGQANPGMPPNHTSRVHEMNILGHSSQTNPSRFQNHGSKAHDQHIFGHGIQTNPGMSHSHHSRVHDKTKYGHSSQANSSMSQNHPNMVHEKIAHAHELSKCKKTGTRRSRTIYTQCDYQVLEALFKITRYPDLDQIENVAIKLYIPETQIRVWFKNRRAKYIREKKLRRKARRVLDELDGSNNFPRRDATGMSEDSSEDPQPSRNDSRSSSSMPNAQRNQSQQSQEYISLASTKLLRAVSISLQNDRLKE